MDPLHLRTYIVRPALVEIGLHSDAAEDLVMGTAAQESHLKWVKQHGDGPALGLFQMEPNTYHDIWSNYLLFNGALAQTIRNAVESNTIDVPHSTRLMWDFRFAAIMCRIHYRRRPEALPAHGDVEAYAAYWKEHYNTHLGAGTEEEFVTNWKRYILEERT